MRGLTLICVAAALAGCGAPAIETALVSSEIPAAGARSKTGNSPYRVYGVTYVPMDSAHGYREEGVASWYGKKFHGRRTSSGERYDMYQMTAAHKTLPLPTVVKVTNLNNRKSVIVKVNDRGPFVGRRIIDLSYAAASELDLVKPGTGPVLVEAINTTPGSVPGRASSYYLQVGSFSVESNARSLRRKLVQAGYPSTKISEYTLAGTLYYQVHVGPWRSLGNVDSEISRLKGIVSAEPLIITE